MPQEESPKRYERFYREVVRPLAKEKRHRDVCDLLINKLDTETDPEFRFELIPDLCVYLMQVGEGEACVHWATVLTEEFDEQPLAWTNMAIFGVGADHNHPLDESEKLQKLGYYKVALGRGRHLRRLHNALVVVHLQVNTAQHQPARVDHNMHVKHAAASRGRHRDAVRVAEVNVAGQWLQVARKAVRARRPAVNSGCRQQPLPSTAAFEIDNGR